MSVEQDITIWEDHKVMGSIFQPDEPAQELGPVHQHHLPADGERAEHQHRRHRRRRLHQATSCYAYNISILPAVGAQSVADSSYWQIQVGIRYEFLRNHEPTEAYFAAALLHSGNR